MTRIFFSTIIILSLSGCATVGSPFQFHGSESIVKGQTTISEILAAYGDPFQVGFENGESKWTYGYYHYRLFGDSDTKDLEITFDKHGVVTSYTYTSSLREEVKRGVSAAMN